MATKLSDDDIWQAVRDAVPHDLFGAAKWAIDARLFRVSHEFAEGMAFGFLLGIGDWRQIAPIWLKEYYAARAQTDAEKRKEKKK